MDSPLREKLHLLKCRKGIDDPDHASKKETH